MVPKCFRYFSEYQGDYRNPPEEDMGHMGHRREANQPTRGWCTPHKGGGRIGLGKGGATPLSFSYSAAFPLSTSGRRKKRGGGGESY